MGSRRQEVISGASHGSSGGVMSIAYHLQGVSTATRPELAQYVRKNAQGQVALPESENPEPFEAMNCQP
jgi:hypothetical protein